MEERNSKAEVEDIIKEVEGLSINFKEGETSNRVEDKIIAMGRSEDKRKRESLKAKTLRELKESQTQSEQSKSFQDLSAHLTFLPTSKKKEEIITKPRTNSIGSMPIRGTSFHGIDNIHMTLSRKVNQLSKLPNRTVKSK
jgi:hypothetical protein